MEITGTLSSVEFSAPYLYSCVCQLIYATGIWSIHYTLESAMCFPASPPWTLGRHMVLEMTMKMTTLMMSLMVNMATSFQVPFANCWDLSNRFIYSVAIIIYTNPS